MSVGQSGSNPGVNINSVVVAEATNTLSHVGKHNVFVPNKPKVQLQITIEPSSLYSRIH
jgi:hypothetical protein